jgi:hypothetical protein
MNLLTRFTKWKAGEKEYTIQFYTVGFAGERIKAKEVTVRITNQQLKANTAKDIAFWQCFDELKKYYPLRANGMYLVGSEITKISD